jgi:hypothetical protein
MYSVNKKIYNEETAGVCDVRNELQGNIPTYKLSQVTTIFLISFNETQLAYEMLGSERQCLGKPLFPNLCLFWES